MREKINKKFVAVFLALIIAAVFIIPAIAPYMREASAALLSDTIFAPRKPKVQERLSIAIKWAKTQFTSIENEQRKQKSDADLSDYSSDFTKANDLYKDGEYKKAAAAYAAIIKECPVHLAARNNYILASVHIEEFEEALRQSVLLALLSPSYEGNQVNILIPVYALGFSEKDLLDAWKEYKLPEFEKIEDDDIFDAYVYNSIYAGMETEISDETGEVKKVLAEYKEKLDKLIKKDPDDLFAKDLSEYLEGLRKIRVK